MPSTTARSALVYRYHERFFRLALLLSGDAQTAAALLEAVFRQLPPGTAPDAAESLLARALLAERLPRRRWNFRPAEIAHTGLDAAAADALLGVLAAPSLIALLNTLAIGVIERTREIGMLRAIGATRRQVRQIVLAEALLLAVIGTAFGLLAGLYLGYVLILGLGSAGYPVAYVFPSNGLIAATVVGLLLGVVAALLPARQAARMNIVRALRYE